MKRFLALALSLLMILGVLLMAGCDSNTGDSTTTKKPSTGTTAGSSGDVQDTTTTGGDDTTEFTGYEKLPGYEDISFGGRVFTLIGCDGEADGFNSAKEIYSEESDAISVAVRDRNGTIEDLYDCVIKGVSSPDPAKAASDEITGNQHTIDLYTHHYSFNGVATGGNAYNLKEIGSREIDFSKPWFDQQFVNSYTIKNSSGKDTLYTIIGDFALTAFDCTHALVYNKTVYSNTTEIKDIDIYQLVKDKQWTMDVFATMIKAATTNSDGDPAIDASAGDIAGWVRTVHASHGMHTASGLTIMSNKDGKLSFDVEKNTESWVNVIAKAAEIWALPGAQTLGYTSLPAIVAGGYALFESEILGSSLGNLKDYECEIGLLPYPLYSETQENYAHYVDSHVYGYSIPASVPDPDTVADFLAIYAFHSTYIVRPAYINVYAYDYCSDPESADMLDIILSTMTYDPGYLSAALESDISSFIQNNNNAIAQYAQRRATTANDWINNLIAGIDDNKI